MQKQMDHSKYQDWVKTLPIESLHYIIRDAYEAAKAMPYCLNCGYYLDEINYCASELKRRSY